MTSKREHALAAIRFAGYHGDAASATTWFVRSRVSHAAMCTAFQEGLSAALKGVGCSCNACRDMDAKLAPEFLHGDRTHAELARIFGFSPELVKISFRRAQAASSARLAAEYTAGLSKLPEPEETG